MKGLSKFLGRGLLVLALGSCFVACGDDDDDSAPDDGGAGEGGTGGTTAGKGGTGGKGGGGGMGGAGKGGSAGDTGTMSCEDKAETASDMAGSSVDTNAMCISCLCDMGKSAAEACTPDCWKLAYCVAASGCGENDSDCIRMNCVDDLGGMTKYMAAAVLAVNVKFTECAERCFDDTGDAGAVDAGR